jgi:hypothetical protein
MQQNFGFEQRVTHLDDSAAIWMCGEHYNLIVKSRYDELYSVRRNAFNALLNHMVSILVTHTPHNMSIQLRHQLCLLISIYNFQCLTPTSHKTQDSHQM